METLIINSFAAEEAGSRRQTCRETKLIGVQRDNIILREGLNPSRLLTGVSVHPRLSKFGVLLIAKST